MVARSSLTTTSKDPSAIGLLKRRKPEKDNRHAAARLKSDKLPELCASLSSASRISNVTGDFFTTGLAKDLFNPALVASTIEEDVGESRPAVDWTHARALYASSTADVDLQRLEKYCRYNANSC